MISMIIRLIEDDYDSFQYEYEPEGNGFWSRRTYQHLPTGVRISFSGDKEILYINRVKVGFIDKWRISRAIRRATAQRILNYLTNRTHPDLPALTAPRA